MFDKLQYFLDKN